MGFPALLNEMPFLRAGVSGPDDPRLVVFRIAKGECAFWTMGDNFVPNEQKLQF